MAVRPAPIVITLKKRLGPPRLLDPEEISDVGATRGPSMGAATGPGAARRSRSRSPRRSPSPSPPSPRPAIAPSSVLNAAALEDIFARFHGQLDTWLQAESGKLERAESRGNASRDMLRRGADRVCGFLCDYAPGAHTELGPDPSGEGFITRALPQFLDIIDEDRRALQEVAGALGAFADRRFPKSEELACLKAESSPLPLLRATLRLLASQTKATAGHRKRAARSQGAPAKRRARSRDGSSGSDSGSLGR